MAGQVRWRGECRMLHDLPRCCPLGLELGIMATFAHAQKPLK
jgi:hypothetical protein